MSFNKSLLTADSVLMEGEAKGIRVKCLVNMSCVPHISVAFPLPLLLGKGGRHVIKPQCQYWRADLVVKSACNGPEFGSQQSLGAAQNQL